MSDEHDGLDNEFLQRLAQEQQAEQYAAAEKEAVSSQDESLTMFAATVARYYFALLRNGLPKPVAESYCGIWQNIHLHSLYYPGDPPGFG